jgi:glycosyltransferase involved in cell wall biosynthesis
MPAYNAAQWIGEAIDSALAQTWDEFELVVSDDASTDSTLDVARSYADPRIRVEASRQHLGGAGTITGPFGSRPDGSSSFSTPTTSSHQTASRRWSAGARGRAHRPGLLAA